MLQVSPGFLAALAAPQRVTVRADVHKAGASLFSGLPVTGGSIEVDASAVTRRKLTLELAPMLRRNGDPYFEAPTMPRAPGDPLGHYGQEVSVEWGLTYPDDTTEWLPLGVFRVDEVQGSLLDDDTVTVHGSSREAFVADCRFTQPRTVSGPSAVAIITTLIHQAIGSDVEVVAQVSRDRRVPRTTFDEDRWGAITTLAQSLAAVVYADPFGRFVIADAPTADTPPVWTVAAGPGGVLVEARSGASREKVYNALVVRGESASGDTPPVQGTAFDEDPTSPTRWGSPADGAFGRVPRFMTLPTVTSREQARAIARANLYKYVGAASAMDLSTVPNPALEAGDVIDVVTDPTVPAGGTVRRHVVDRFTVPLTPGGAFPVQTRDLREVVVDDAA